MIDGKECQIGLIGDSISLYENTTPSVSTESKYLTVPHRCQWELFWDLHGYTAASQACGDTVCAMLEEYYTDNAPDIWDIYQVYGSMTAYEAEEYLQGQDIDLDRRTHQGTLSYVIECGQYYIDTNRPFYLAEENSIGTAHAVTATAYNDASNYFLINDPLSVSGGDIMYWYEEDNFGFNFEENVYEHVGGSDPYSDGMVIVV